MVVAGNAKVGDGLAKIVHLSSVHPPFDTRIFHKEAKTLARAGYEVVFVVPHDEAVTSDGVRMHPIRKRRGRLARMIWTVRDVFRAAVAEDGDIYFFHDPELIPVGLLLKLRGKRVIYDVHEDRPRQMLTKYWIPPRLRRFVSRLTHLVEAASGRVWDGIVVATPPIARLFPGRKTVIVQNFPILDELITADPIPYGDRPPQVSYVGSLTGIRGAREMVLAMGLLPSESNARLDLAGPFDPPSLEDELRTLPGWERTTSHGWLHREDVAALLGRTRVGLVLLHPADNYLEAQPNKLFEYMSTGLPVVASNFPYWREMVEADRCGLLVDPLDPQAIADAIQWLLDRPEEAEAMGRRGEAAVRERFNWEIESRPLLNMLASKRFQPKRARRR